MKASKTDPFRMGVDIFIGRTDNELCPVSAVLAYMSVSPGVHVGVHVGQGTRSRPPFSVSRMVNPSPGLAW